MFPGSVGPTIALIGDSHASAFSDSLLETVRPKGYGFYVNTMSGCPPLIGFRRAIIGYEECEQRNQALIEYILSENGIEWVFLSAQWALYVDGIRFDNGRGGTEVGGDTFYFRMEQPEDRDSKTRKRDVVEGYMSFIEVLLASGKKVLVIDQIPTAGWDIGARFLRISQLSIPENDDFTYPISRHHERIASTRRLATFTHSNFHLLDPARIFCANGRVCRSSLLPVPFFMDHSHLLDAGSKLVAEHAPTILRKSRP
jgi:hypothetical protein